MRLILVLMLCLSFLSVKSQSFKTVKFTEVEAILNSTNDTLYIINFWATWCGPCVAELPYFEELTEKYKTEKLKVILITMDFKSDVEKRLIPFLDKKKLNSKVWWLDEAKQSDLIGKIEDTWYGEIPFTLLRKGSTKDRFWKAGKWEKEVLNQKVIDYL